MEPAAPSVQRLTSSSHHDAPKGPRSVSACLDPALQHEVSFHTTLLGTLYADLDMPMHGCPCMHACMLAVHQSSQQHRSAMRNSLLKVLQITVDTDSGQRADLHPPLRHLPVQGGPGDPDCASDITGSTGWPPVSPRLCQPQKGHSCWSCEGPAGCCGAGTSQLRLPRSTT